MNTGDEYFVPTASTRQRRAIERVNPSRHTFVVSTNCSHAKSATKKHDARETPEDIGEVSKDVEEATILERLRTRRSSLVMPHTLLQLYGSMR